MAAVNNNTDLIMEVVSHEGLNGNNAVCEIEGTIVDQDGMGVADEDMLNEALVTAPESFPDGVQFQYSMTDENGSVQEGVMLGHDGEQVSFINNEDETEASSQLTHTFVAENCINFVENGGDQFIQQVVDSVDSKDANGNNSLVIEQADSNTINDQQLMVAAAQNMPNVVQQPVIVTQQDKGDGAPLGSSQNPIRIIQQGNQYTPVQQLSTDQLQQIMHVVQQQQSLKNPGSSVLYNSQTNTKIVYRVIYPSQLHKDGESSRQVGQQALLTPKRVNKKRAKDEEIEKFDGPELSKEEKEMRKKVRPKTRSGRVSKPPKHMVKDFKHIHVLDYDEDYDDDDGGYSDFKYSDAEDEGTEPVMSRKDDEDGNFVAYGLDTNKPKNWKCVTCGKAYIGRGGLARHLRINPNHGSMDPEGDGDMEPPDGSSSNTSLAAVSETPDAVCTPISIEDNIAHTPTTPNGLNSTANSTGSFSEDSRDSSLSLPYNPTPRPRGTGQRGRPRGSRASWRGRGAYSKVDPETKRRNKLKEAARDCTDEELMEIVLPRLAKVITLWEFLLMKVEKGDPAWPHADDIYKEYEKVHHHVQKLCQEYLQFLPPEASNSENQHPTLQLENESVASALGLSLGAHRVKDISDSDTDVQYRYKYLTTNHDFTHKNLLKRTVEVVSPEQLVSPSKRAKITLTPIKAKYPVVDTGNNKYTDTSTKLLVSPMPDVSMVNSKKQGLPAMQIISQNLCDRKSVQNAANSGTATVSLLSNTFPSKLSPHMTPRLSPHLPPQLQSVTSLEQPSSSSNNLTQKIILVSGMNQTASTIPVSSAARLVRDDGHVRTNDKENQLIAPAATTTPQFISIPNGQNNVSQNKVLIHDSVTGTYTMADLTNNIPDTRQQTSNEMKVNTHPVLIKLPQQATSSQYLQPKLVLNEANMLNSVPNPAGDLRVSDAQTFVAGADISQMLVPANESAGVNTVTSIGDTANQNIVLTFQSNESQCTVNTQDGHTDNVVYTFANGSDMTPQDNVVFVNPESLFLNKQETDGLAGGMLIEGDSPDTVSHLLIDKATNEEEVGVISSVDDVDALKIETNASMTSDQQAKQRGELGDSAIKEDIVIDSGLSGQQQEQDVNLNNMSTLVTTDDTIQTAEADVNDVIKDEPQQVETLQLPATNIFQTEDGTVLIQNPDGTTLQLQASDGQAVSMETVHALLGIEGDIVTEMT